MGRGPANQALRGIETLYATGPIGALTDAQLVDRFLNRDGRDREDAFSALVQRHGPMVLTVCRRALASAADADDAFQAVFLVLARNARSVRRVESLRSWLYGVAVRTAKESRRRSARLHAREGGVLADPPAAPAPDADLFELRALLDEELGRLPSRYREPLLLCELEGASRQDAARRLGLPEGTLSTRLARGRVLLRDRLIRRGVAVAALAAIVPEPARASSLGPLADAATRLALKFTTPDLTVGAIPTAVASLAEGVLSMIASAKLKAALAAVSSIVVATGLTAGLAWGFIADRTAEPTDDPKPVAAEVREPKSDLRSSPIVARGVVVDEEGRPASGAEVRVGAYTAGEFRCETDRDGTFAVPIAKGRANGRPVLVRTADGRKIGVFSNDYDLTKAPADAPARIVVKPCREVVAHVADANKVGIPGAAVEVAAGFLSIVDHQITGADGVARLSVPGDAKVTWIVAQKGGAGFDYAEFGEIDPLGGSHGGVAGSKLPGSISLVLDAPRTARIKAVDSNGKPAAGVDFSVGLLDKEGRRSHVNYQSRLHQATTDADGIATFDWLPKTKHPLVIFPASEEYAHHRIFVDTDQTEIPVARLARLETIRGRVVLADGSPAKDVEVVARGSGRGLDVGFGRVRTAADGSYEMRVDPDQGYVVYVKDDKWAAPARLDVAVRAGKPVDGVDFRLTPGTQIRGTVVDLDGRTVPDVIVGARESGGEVPADLRDKDDRGTREFVRGIIAKSDAQGRYAIHAGPGVYRLTAGSQPTPGQTITVKDEPELVHDFRIPRPAGRGPLTGRVVGPDGKSRAGATVKITDAEGEREESIPMPVRVDADGRFQTVRTLHRAYLDAKSVDGSLGAVVEIGPEATDVLIPLAPTATARGVLVDGQNKPAANRLLFCWRQQKIEAGGKSNSSTHAYSDQELTTDREGRFTLPGLVVGQTYVVSMLEGNEARDVGVVHPQAPGPIDALTLRIGYGARP